jgi:hypothetical protein
MVELSARSLYNMHSNRAQGLDMPAASSSSSTKPDRKKYAHPEYEDRQIDGLVRYFSFETYSELKWFLRGTGKEQ